MHNGKHFSAKHSLHKRVKSTKHIWTFLPYYVDVYVMYFVRVLHIKQLNLLLLCLMLCACLTTNRCYIDTM